MLIKPNVLRHYIFILLIGTVLTGWSQKGWELGGLVGVTNYYGDLNTNFDMTEAGPTLGLVGRYNFNVRTGISFIGNYALIKASDENAQNAYQKARNLHFRSNVWAGTLLYEFNFFPYEHGKVDRSFSPYIFTGISLFKFNPKAKYHGEWMALQPLGTEGQTGSDDYWTVSGAYVIGGGFKFDISKMWSVNIFFSTHLTWTDYLDDVSSVYPNKLALFQRNGQMAVDLSDPSVFQNEFPEIGTEGKQRGDINDKDSYSFFQVSFMRYFGSIRCPKISDGI